MTYPIYTASSQVMIAKPKFKRSSKYPWSELKLGQAFVIAEGDISYPSLLTLARRTSMRHEREYRVYHHKDNKCYEVAYVADVQKPTAKSEQATVQIAPANVVLDEVRKMGEGE